VRTSPPMLNRPAARLHGVQRREGVNNPLRVGAAMITPLRVGVVTEGSTYPSAEHRIVDSPDYPGASRGNHFPILRKTELDVSGTELPRMDSDGPQQACGVVAPRG